MFGENDVSPTQRNPVAGIPEPATGLPGTDLTAGPTFGQADTSAKNIDVPPATAVIAKRYGMTPEQWRAAGGKPPLKARVGKGIDDFLASTAQGFLFGYGDEAAARLGARSYDEGKKFARERYDDVPLAIKIPGEIAGAVGQAAITGPILGVAKAIPAIDKAATAFGKLPGWIKATGVGGLYGALFGSGTADDDNRLEGAVIGGVAGAAGGLTTYGLAQGSYRLYRNARDLVKSKLDPNGYATELLARALSRDETTAATATGQLKALGAKGMIADVGGRSTPGGEIVGGENVLGLAKATATMPGTGRNQGAIRLAIRAEGEANRIETAVSKFLQPKDYLGSEEKLLGKLKQIGDDVYQPIFEKFKEVETTPGLQRLLKESPDIQRAVSLAAANVARARAAGESKWLGPIDEELTSLARAARDAGVMAPGEIPRGGVMKNFSLETWHEIKVALQELLNSPRFTKELTGKVNKSGYGVIQEIDALTRELGKATGGKESPYLAANAAYRGTAETLEALRAGKEEFMRMTAPEVRQFMDKLSDAGKSAFRSGAARAFMDRVEKSGDQSAVAKAVFGNPAMRKRLAALDIGDDGAAWSNFAGRMRAEQRMSRAATEIKSGSRGSAILSDLEQNDPLRRALGTVGTLLGQLAPVGHPLTTARIGRETAMRAVGVRDNPAVLNELSKMLFTQNRATQNFVLRQVGDLVAAGKLPPDKQMQVIAQLLAKGGASQEKNFVRPLVRGAGLELGALGGGQFSE